MTARTKKRSPKLGHDPLAWLSEPEEETTGTANRTQPSAEVPADDHVMPADLQSSNEPAEQVPVAADQSDSASDQSVVTLPERFGIAQVSEIKLLMEEKLAGAANELVINAEKVESIDSAAMQLLLCVSRQAESDGKVMRFSADPPKIRSVAELLNVCHLLNLN